MRSLSADRDLLLGVMALQLNLLARDHLLAAVQAWAREPDKPLATFLAGQEALGGDAGAALHTLAQKYLASHGHDVRKALAGLPAFAAFLLELEGLGEPGFLDTLSLGDDSNPPPDGTLVTPEHPEPGASRAARAPTATGARFRILKPHAKGGLGLVYLARDEELRRDVALKEIQPQYADQPDSRARFVLEAEVTGGLEHPGVIPVYGLGTYADGRPFYAMRFIKGDSLKEAIAQFHQADGGPGAHNLRLRHLLGRFVDVCNVLAYAHSRGVLHRDVKPANIMLGPYGETLVVDWGLAKALGERQPSEAFAEQTLHPSAGADSATQAGKVVGTPAYMSPEQAAGHPDALGPASDVYSLGATLYHLLTGRPAFAETRLAALLRRVEAGDFPRPRQVKPGIPAALEAVCLKAMALRPRDRYASAKELAEDVEHWLADEPVKAWREPAAAQAGRWLRRHRTLVASGVAALAVAALLLAGATALLSLAYDREVEARGREALARAAAEQARAEAQGLRDEALRQQKRADDNFAKALRAVEDYLNQVTEHPKLKQNDFFDLRRDLLKTAVPFYDDFVKQRGGDARLEAERGQAYWRLAFVRAKLGEAEQAVRDYRRAVAVFAGLAESFPGVPVYRQDLAHSHNHLGNLFRELNQIREAEDAFRTSYRIRQALADAHPEVPAYRHDLAQSHHNLGTLYHGQGKRPEAEKEYDAAARLHRALAEAHPEVPAYRHGLARAHNNLGLLLFEWDRRAEAEQSYREAIRLFGAAADAAPGVAEYRRDLARGHNNLANLLQLVGKKEQAEESYRAAAALQQALADAFPGVPEYRRELARSQSNLGLLLNGLGRRPQAEAAFREAVRLLTPLAVGFPGIPAYRAELASAHERLGNLHADLGQYPGAEAAFREAVRLRQALADAAPGAAAPRRDLARGHIHLGQLLLTDGRPPAALPELDRAVALLGGPAAEQPLSEAGRALLGDALAGRAEALERLKRRPDAARDWERARALWPEARHGQLRMRKALALARAGVPTEATAEAEALLTGAPAGGRWYNGARVFALSAAAGDDAALREQYARRAVALLGQAHETGYFKDAGRLARLQKDADLASLRQRDDFRKLLARIEKGS